MFVDSLRYKIVTILKYLLFIEYSTQREKK